MERQLESFQTPKGEIVLVNKATITYAKQVEHGHTRIYFNSPSINNTVQSVVVDCCIEEVEKILNGE